MQKTKHQIITFFLQELRNSHPEQVEIFTRGSCLNLFCMLRVICPEAKCYYNENHVITKIGDHYYDIKGTKRNLKGYLPFTELYSNKRTSRAFSQMYQATHEIIKERLSDHIVEVNK